MAVKNSPKKNAAAASKAATKPAEKKTVDSKAQDVKAQAAEAKVAEKAAPAKTEPAKAAAPKADKKKAPTVKKPATAKKQERSSQVFLEMGDQQIETGEIIKKIEDAYKEEGHQVGRIKDLKVYVNYKEERAYYVINGNTEGKFVELL